MEKVKEYAVFRGTLCHDFLYLFCIVLHFNTLISKICDTRYDISCFCHTSIIQKNVCHYNKIHIKLNFFLPPFRSVLLLVLVWKLLLKKLFVAANYLGINIADMNGDVLVSRVECIELVNSNYRNNGIFLFLI